MAQEEYWSVGAWEQSWVCEDCKHPMSNGTKMYSNGVCPSCGYDDDSTICAVINKPRRKVRKTKPTWWEYLLRIGWEWEYKNE